MGCRSRWNANFHTPIIMTYENIQIRMDLDGQDVLVEGSVIEDRGDYWTPGVIEANVKAAWIEDDPVDLDFDQIQIAERLLLEEVGVYL